MLATIRHTRLSTPEQGSVPPLVIVHGLYGSGRNWNAIARRLSAEREVILLDQRNHGESPRFASHSYPEMAQDIAEVIESLNAGPVDLLGHSMGGKAVMQLALTQGALVNKLIVADIAPVSYSHDQSQYARAMSGVPLDTMTSRSAADRALQEQGIDDPNLRGFFLQSLDLKAEGGPKWRLNLPVLMADMDKIVGWPNTLGQFNGPSLFLTGNLSHYVRTEHRPAIRAQFPHAHFAKLIGAGHWLHADRPEEFAQTVTLFLNNQNA